MIILWSNWLLLTRFESCQTRVDLCWTRVDSCWLVSDSCWLVLIRVDSCRTRVDSCRTRVDSCWLVLIRVDLCWYSCIRIGLIEILHVNINFMGNQSWNKNKHFHLFMTVMLKKPAFYCKVKTPYEKTPYNFSQF